jgi:triacylglycerol lipase
MKKLLQYLLCIIIFAVLIFGAIVLYERHLVDKSITDNTGEYVVLLHGLGRTSLSMQKLAVSLSKNGYRVINISYPSRSDTIENLVKNNLAIELDKKYIDKNKKINFVTHSMGAVMVRYYLATHKVENLHRVVMLSPPNRGGEAADRWVNNRIVNFLMGPALAEMTTDQFSFVNQLPAPNYEVGIIAGKYDKKVLLERAKLEGMKDFLVVEQGHTWIMRDSAVAAAIVKFLNNGHF